MACEAGQATGMTGNLRIPEFLVNRQEADLSMTSYDARTVPVRIFPGGSGLII